MTNRVGVKYRRNPVRSSKFSFIAKFRPLVYLCLLAGVACGAADGESPSHAASAVRPADPALIAQAEALGFESVPFGSIHEEELEILYQQRLQICMQTHGFEYFPVGFNSTNPPTRVGTFTFSDGRSIAHDEMAAAYGFGVVEEMLIFVRDPEGLEIEDDFDPNTEYVNSLSDSAQERYWAAFDDEESGCAPVVEASFGGPPVIYDYDELLDLAYEDLRIVEFVDSWSSCIRAEGYEFSDPGDPLDFFEEETRRVMDEVNARMRADPNVQFSTAQRDLIAALETLQREEIEVAQASESCGGTAYENQRLLDEIILGIQAQEDE